jgi:hypothetical protein
VTTFTFLTASQWGMEWARTPQTEKLVDPECYVHHTAGAHPAAAVEAFRALNRYAIDVKGYSAVDYDILVHRNPTTGEVTIGEARGPWRSAATLDRNEEGEAICLLGYFGPGSKHSRQPHPDEIEGVARGIVWGIEKGWLADPPEILGHRDNPAHPGATSCPGDYLYAELPKIRVRVAELLAPVPPPEPPPLNPLEVPSGMWIIAKTDQGWLASPGIRQGAFKVAEQVPATYPFYASPTGRVEAYDLGTKVPVNGWAGMSVVISEAEALTYMGPRVA